MIYIKNRNLKRILYIVIICLGLLCFIYGLASSQWGHNLLMKHYTNKTEMVSHNKIENNLKRKANFDPRSVHALRASDMVRGWNYKAKPIGYLVIPSLNMKNSIFNGYGLHGNNLLYGVATMKPNQIMGAGNYALAGHYMNTQTVFHNLSKAKVGKNVYLTDLKFIYKYRISSVKHGVSEKRVDVIDDHMEMTQVTMITCESLTGGSLRTIVQGDLLATYLVTNKKLKQLNLIS